MLNRRTAFYLFLVLIFLSGCSKNDIEKVSEVIDAAEGVVSAAEDLKEVVKQPKNTEPEEYLPVVRVVDGDTLVAKGSSGDEIKVRLLMVDTPEVHNVEQPEPYGLNASEFTKELLKGQSVRFEYDKEKTDPYGRTLAYVYLPDGRMVNEEVLRAGLAEVVVYEPNNKYEDSFREIEQKAKTEGLGLWSK